MCRPRADGMVVLLGLLVVVRVRCIAVRTMCNLISFLRMQKHLLNPEIPSYSFNSEPVPPISIAHKPLSPIFRSYVLYKVA